jgi:predicted metal-dependent TIM-barrel fold hydrolase
MDLLPRFLAKEGVVAVGEIGYDDQTAAEEKYFRKQLELAKETDLPVMIHTPHRNKKQGTTRSMDVIEEMGIQPHMVVIDHNNEETVKEVLKRGYWAAFTIYPKTKMGKERMVEIVRTYGAERIIVDSAADWGVSNPLSVPETAKLMVEKGIPEPTVRSVTYGNALLAYGQSGQFRQDPPEIDQRQLYQGSSVLRGGQEPRVT